MQRLTWPRSCEFTILMRIVNRNSWRDIRDARGAVESATKPKSSRLNETMEIIRNPRWLKNGLASDSSTVGIDAPKAVNRFLAECPAHKPTPLERLGNLAAELGVKEIFV